MHFILCLVRDHAHFPFIFSVFMLGNRIIFLFLVFRMKWHPLVVHIWNFAVTDIGALVFLCSIFLFFSVGRIRGGSSDDLVESVLSLAYLFVCMQCTTIHCLMAISVDWCLVVLFPTCHRPKYISDLISATVSALLWALSSPLLFFFNLGVDPQIITMVLFIFFAPLTVSLTLTLILKVWRNLGEQGKLCKEILLAMFFSVVILVPLRLFFTLHRYLEAIPSLLLTFFALSCINAPVHYVIVWKLGLASPESGLE